MRGWRACGGGNQRDSEMNERTLKRGKESGLKAHREIAAAKVEISRGSRVYSFSRLNCSNGALDPSDVNLPYKTTKKLLLPVLISATIRPIEDKKGGSGKRRMDMMRRRR